MNLPKFKPYLTVVGFFLCFLSAGTQPRAQLGRLFSGIPGDNVCPHLNDRSFRLQSLTFSTSQNSPLAS